MLIDGPLAHYLTLTNGDNGDPSVPHGEVSPTPPLPNPMLAGGPREEPEETTRTRLSEGAPIHLYPSAHPPPGTSPPRPHPGRHSHVIGGAAKARAFLEEPCSPTPNTQPLPPPPPGPPPPTAVHISKVSGPTSYSHSTLSTPLIHHPSHHLPRDGGSNPQGPCPSAQRVEGVCGGRNAQGSTPHKDKPRNPPLLSTPPTPPPSPPSTSQPQAASPSRYTIPQRRSPPAPLAAHLRGLNQPAPLATPQGSRGDGEGNCTGSSPPTNAVTQTSLPPPQAQRPNRSITPALHSPPTNPLFGPLPHEWPHWAAIAPPAQPTRPTPTEGDAMEREEMQMELPPPGQPPTLPPLTPTAPQPSLPTPAGTDNQNQVGCRRKKRGKGGKGPYPYGPTITHTPSRSCPSVGPWERPSPLTLGLPLLTSKLPPGGSSRVRHRGGGRREEGCTNSRRSDSSSHTSHPVRVGGPFPQPMDYGESQGGSREQGPYPRSAQPARPTPPNTLPAFLPLPAGRQVIESPQEVRTLMYAEVARSVPSFTPPTTQLGSSLPCPMESDLVLRPCHSYPDVVAPPLVQPVTDVLSVAQEGTGTRLEVSTPADTPPPGVAEPPCGPDPPEGEEHTTARSFGSPPHPPSLTMRPVRPGDQTPSSLAPSPPPPTPLLHEVGESSPTLLPGDPLGAQAYLGVPSTASSDATAPINPTDTATSSDQVPPILSREDGAGATFGSQVAPAPDSCPPSFDMCEHLSAVPVEDRPSLAHSDLQFYAVGRTPGRDFSAAFSARDLGLSRGRPRGRPRPDLPPDPSQGLRHSSHGVHCSGELRVLLGAVCTHSLFSPCVWRGVSAEFRFRSEPPSRGACFRGRACPSHLSLTPCPFDFPSGRRCRSVAPVGAYADPLRIPEAQWQVASSSRLGLPIPQLALPGSGGQWGQHQLRGRVVRGAGGQRGQQGGQTGQDGEGGQQRQQQESQRRPRAQGAAPPGLGSGMGQGREQQRADRGTGGAAGSGGEDQGVKEAAGDRAGGLGELGEGRGQVG
ncbi:unnamed protein product [Closterium sp. NIES-53]